MPAFRAPMFGNTKALPRITSYAGGSGGYNSNPPPQAGVGPYGAVPGAIGVPDPFGDLSRLYPNLSGTNSKIASNIASELSGELSPDTIAAIQDEAARFGVSSGMPGSGLAGNRGLRSLGLNIENQKRLGLRDYNSVIPNLSHTQTVSPELQTNIADRNSVFGAAPNPGAANLTAQDLFRRGFGSFSSPGSVTGRSGGSFVRGSNPTPQGSVMDMPNPGVVTGTNPIGFKAPGPAGPAGRGIAGVPQSPGTFNMNYGMNPNLPLPGQNDFSELFNFDGVDANSFIRPENYDPNAAWIDELLFGGDTSNQEFPNVGYDSGYDSGTPDQDWMDQYY